jgi:hypothetical protein
MSIDANKWGGGGDETAPSPCKLKKKLVNKNEIKAKIGDLPGNFV